MRVHSLSLTAFGPFPDRVDVDFDALCEGGLFLLAGPTGAGKTSVLDAVTFALYGQVPGERNAAKRLRCDQADPQVAPVVELVATLAGRRFRIRRTPAWVRPKRRGTGTTTAHATILVEEWQAGAWVHLTSRLDEAGDLIASLLGLTVGQFCQVALLPQGEFSSFLRAGPDERQRLLERLFRTERYGRVEQWLRDHVARLRRACDEQRGDVVDLLSRISESAGQPLPDTMADPASAARGDDLDRWLASVATAVAEDADQAARRHAAAEAHAAATRERHLRWRRLAECTDRHDAAQAILDRLDEQATSQDARRARLGAARRAVALRPFHEAVLRARRHHGDATVAWQRAAAGLPAEALDDLDGAAAAATHALLQARASRTQQTQLAQVRRRRERAEDDAQRELGRMLMLRARARDGAAQADVELRQARTETVAARATVLTRREAWLDVREERVRGMAAEIAGALTVGEGCPVCGSPEHPRPARPRAGAPDAEAERMARAQVDDAEAALVGHEDRVRGLVRRLDALTELAETGDGTHADLAAVPAERPGPVPIDVRALARELRAAEVAAAEATASRDELLATEHHAAERLAATLADTGCASIDALLTVRARAADHLQAAVDARARADRWADELAGTEADWARSVRSAGFDDDAAVAASMMAEAGMDELEAAIREHDVARAAALAVLADPAIAAAARAPRPDVSAAARAAESASQEESAAHAAAERLTSRRHRTGELVEQLRDEVSGWIPALNNYDEAAALAALVQGRSADNQWQTRLSAYVLAFRLAQVVAAANERLVQMSDHRYSLVQSGHRLAGQRRGGLGLLVSDDWSGETRDPATLSGGETFVVALALALGLADVITDEAGGADLATLFVDEGFGSLDPDTLDDVLDTLDTLRERGRVVGVVSHVADMADRIPHQLRIAKDRTGSTVSLQVSE